MRQSLTHRCGMGMPDVIAIAVDGIFYARLFRVRSLENSRIGQRQENGRRIVSVATSADAKGISGTVASLVDPPVTLTHPGWLLVGNQR